MHHKIISVRLVDMDIICDNNLNYINLFRFVVKYMAFREQLFGCVSDMFSCLVIWTLPFGNCVMHASATNTVTNKGFGTACAWTLLCCFGMAVNRQDMKRALMIPDNYFADCCNYFWCTACAAAQDYREAENRYLDQFNR